MPCLSPPRGRRARLLVGGALLLALVSFAVPFRAARRVPSLAEWTAAAGRLRRDWQPGDVVRLAPAWASEGLGTLRGLPVDRLRQPEPRALQRHRRLWVLAVQGHRCAEGALPGARPELQLRFGRVELCRFPLRYRGEPLFDFPARVGEARVQRRAGQRVEACAFAAAGGWHCGGRRHAWKFVGPVVKDVDDNPRAALWAHAPEGGMKLIIDYPAVPLGAELELQAGLTLRSVLSGEGSDVQFEVRLAGTPVLRRQLGPRQGGWFDWSIPTPGWTGRTVPVQFVVWAKDNQVRQFLFDARTWER